MTSRVILFAALLLAGCGHSSETRFWTLDPVAPGLVPIASGLTPIHVDAVHVPMALDRLEIVEQTAANRLSVHDFDRWSAPLPALLRRTLTQDLVARLPAGSVVFPDTVKPRGTRSLVVDVLDLRPFAEGYLFDVGWTLGGAGDGHPARRGQQRFTTPLTGSGVAGQVDATRRLVSQLADRLAAVARE